MVVAVVVVVEVVVVVVLVVAQSVGHYVFVVVSLAPPLPVDVQSPLLRSVHEARPIALAC